MLAFDLPEEDHEVEELVARREQARAAGEFAVADRIRDQLLERGVVVEDTADGPRWKRQG